MRTVAVVGASLAGLSAARALRDQGYDGGLVLIGDEPHRPYDRPPLSKEFLAGRMSEADLALETETEDLDATWILGAAAEALDPGERAVRLGDGRSVRADAVVIATGASARTLPGTERLSGVHTLRTLDDARALRADLAGAGRLVVIGAGFIGAEIASTARTLGLHVTLVEPASAPLAAAIGAEMGAVVAGLQAGQGVEVLCGTGVREVTGTARAAGAPRVDGVILTDGRRVPADVVVVGIGARPGVGWLAGSGVDVGDGVLCDATGATTLPGVIAVGDCAAWFDPAAGSHRRVEHWTGAVRRPAVAVRALLAGASAGSGSDIRPPEPPYFWSDQCGTRIQFAGHARPGDEITVEEGSLADRSFVAVYRRGDRPVAVLGIDLPRPFTRWRKRLAADALRSPAPAA
ncbi:NAD(P)/FAD-dependent oxidoreductase [Sphaerimonospora thailandensis]|uniref:NAD(P)/FAD-dependent oxidoreductase n=1 Tax=Sphaerimonospora thailandensis TaxID=795644 RepID=UPI001950B477|nr:FAD-dependent oxidoreductase [Sphaerimonospora thailandensis]